MRLTEAEWLQNHKSTWLSQVLESTGWGVNNKQNTLDTLNEFFSTMVSAIDLRNPACADPLLESWVREQVPTTILGAEVGVPLFLRQLMQATYITCETFLSGNRLTDLYELIVHFFSYCFQKSSELQTEYHLSSANVNLKEIKKIGEKLELSKTAFIEIAAHELRTPIALIKGYTTMMQHNIAAIPENTEQKRLLEGINTGMERLNEVINNMLLVAMIDNNRLDLSLQPIWLGKTIRIFPKDLEETIKARNIKIVLKGFKQRDRMVFGDPLRLKQAFQNLIQNAVKFTPDGGKITISLREQPPNYIITISDTGIGISKTNQLRLFNRFNYIGDISHYTTGKSSFKGGGPGLGLYIAKGIIDAHEGSISVYSRGYDEAKLPGTTFTITLPMQHSNSKQPDFQNI